MGRASFESSKPVWHQGCRPKPVSHTASQWLTCNPIPCSGCVLRACYTLSHLILILKNKAIILHHLLWSRKLTFWEVRWLSHEYHSCSAWSNDLEFFCGIFVCIPVVQRFELFLPFCGTLIIAARSLLCLNSFFTQYFPIHTAIHHSHKATILV